MTDSVEEPLVEQQPYATVTYKNIVSQFVLMGWTAFGGPQAHIALFETNFIQKHIWMSESVFLELFSLSSCLPGPTSTQVSFALGAVKKGIPGGLLGGALFQYPGLFMMSAVGVGAANFLKGEHWWSRAAVDGLAAVAVALVAVAAKGLIAKVAKDALTTTILVASAAISFVFAAPWLFPALIVAGGLITWGHNVLRKVDMSLPAMQADEGVLSYGMSRVSGTLLLLAWAAVLIAATVARAATSYTDHWAQPLHWFETFYRVGSLIYGGGQVVLPMLLTETVQYDCFVDDHGKRHCEESPDSWVTADQFKAGLAIIQAMPGPMFNLSAYLGAVMAVRAGWAWPAGVAACWLGLFGPGIMLLYGLLPFWGSFRQLQAYRRALPGLAAAAVGLVVMAVFSMYNTFTASSVFPKTSVAIGMLGFYLVDQMKHKPPYVIVLGGLLGVVAARLNMP